jgi:2-phospho-L-lactate/phosphoenolpyruvate guanylyltransferase
VRVAALVPVKRFDAAKGRLAGAVDEQQRERLARWTANSVVGAFGDIDVYVACDNNDVAEWARELGHAVIWGPGLGLNGAIDDGVAAVADAGYDQVVIAHADLPRPASLTTVARRNTITLVPDDRRDGTNVMSFPLTDTVQAAYGAGSFERHLAAAQLVGISVEVRPDPDLALDIDTPDDLTHPLIREVLPTWLRTNQANHRSV